METQEATMEQEQARVGRRIQVNMPGAGDHRQVGTIKKIRSGKCYVHLDWDQQPQHLVMFYATDLDHLAGTPLPGPAGHGTEGGSYE